MTGNAIIETVQGKIVPSDGVTALEVAGRAANGAAARAAFQEYRGLKADNTLRAQDAALARFTDFLSDAGLSVNADDLATSPRAWRGVTMGLVKAFRGWQRDQGYAISTINARLSHIRTYAGLAVEAGVIEPAEGTRIQSVAGYDSREAARVDERRETRGLDTRVGDKKDKPVKLTEEQATALMTEHPDNPQGRRDCVLMYLSLKHGLRVSEIARLSVGDITLTRNESGDVVSGLLRFYRPKVAGTEHEWGEHMITGDTLKSVARYLESDTVAMGPLMRASLKSGELAGAGMTTRALSGRIRTLGEAAGVQGLTAHDCRHYAATRDGKRGKSVRYIMSKFGWTSAQTAMRYVHQEGPVVVD
jgi:integrase